MSGYSQSPVPPKRSDVLWIERVAGGEKQTFTVYSPTIWGVYTHWNGAATKPCYQDRSFCEGGHSEETLRWRGYLHAWSAKLNRPCFVQLTEECARRLLMQVADGATFRGLTLEVSRTSSKKGRLTANVLTWKSQQSDHLPPALDPRKSLEHLWRVKPLDEVLALKLYAGGESIDLPAETA